MTTRGSKTPTDQLNIDITTRSAFGLPVISPHTTAASDNIPAPTSLPVDNLVARNFSRPPTPSTISSALLQSGKASPAEPATSVQNAITSSEIPQHYNPTSSASISNRGGPSRIRNSSPSPLVDIPYEPRYSSSSPFTTIPIQSPIPSDISVLQAGYSSISADLAQFKDSANSQQEHNDKMISILFKRQDADKLAAENDRLQILKDNEIHDRQIEAIYLKIAADREAINLQIAADREASNKQIAADREASNLRRQQSHADAQRRQQQDASDRQDLLTLLEFRKSHNKVHADEAVTLNLQELSTIHEKVTTLQAVSRQQQVAIEHLQQETQDNNSTFFSATDHTPFKIKPSIHPSPSIQLASTETTMPIPPALMQTSAHDSRFVPDHLPNTIPPSANDSRFTSEHFRNTNPTTQSRHVKSIADIFNENSNLSDFRSLDLFHQPELQKFHLGPQHSFDLNSDNRIVKVTNVVVRNSATNNQSPSINITPTYSLYVFGNNRAPAPSQLLSKVTLIGTFITAVSTTIFMDMCIGIIDHNTHQPLPEPQPPPNSNYIHSALPLTLYIVKNSSISPSIHGLNSSLDAFPGYLTGDESPHSLYGHFDSIGTTCHGVNISTLLPAIDSEPIYTFLQILRYIFPQYYTILNNYKLFDNDTILFIGSITLQEFILFHLNY